VTRPRCSFCAPGMSVVERPPGRLGKRDGRLGRKGAVVRCSGFKHLRFATPARAPLHDSYGSAPSCLLGPSPLPGLRSSRAARAGVANLRCSKPRYLLRPNVPPDSRPGLPSPSEQCARSAMVASGRRLERMAGQQGAHEAERGSSDE
jgi:hypothetical protein